MGQLLLRPLGVYAVICILFLLIQKIDLYPHLLISFLLLYLPFLLIHIEKGDMKHFGLELRYWRMSDIGLALKASAIILPPFIFFHMSQGGFSSPDKVFSLILTEIFLVALPEEIFFRGYLQTHLEDVLPKRFELMEVKFGLGLGLTSALFALTHYMLRRDLLSLAVFFPALVFGWLKERTGRVLAPAVFHALCNIVYFLFPF